jgi:molybdate transport system substrate-binding protein
VIARPINEEKSMRTRLLTAAIIAAAGALPLAGAAGAAEIKVLSTQATEAAYRELVPLFEKASGHKVTTVFNGTLGVMKRLAEGETCDLVIMSSPSIDELIKSGRLAAGSRVDIAKSGVGVAVKKGAKKPDVSSTEALKKTLLAAKSIGYSTGPSGNYVVSMFDKMGIGDQVKPKLKQTPTGVFVGSLIAGGDVEIGFQQVSELVHYSGLDYLGPLPAEVQFITVFSGGIPVATRQADEARALLKFLTAPASAPVIRKYGLAPG